MKAFPPKLTNEIVKKNESFPSKTNQWNCKERMKAFLTKLTNEIVTYNFESFPPKLTNEIAKKSTGYLTGSTT